VQGEIQERFVKTRPDAMIEGRRLGHVPALDGIRALAALAVVGLHARIVGFDDGAIGVDVFFVLSGFLITSILLAHSGPATRLDYRDFYRRRALRLLPVYFAVVACCVTLDFVQNMGGTVKGAVAGLFYMANWLAAADPTALGMLYHTWSLSVEEQFYLIWPALLAFILTRYKWSAKRAMRAVAVLMLASWLLAVALSVIGAAPMIAQRATPTRAFELLAGALLAIFVATPSRSGALQAVRSTSSVSVAAAVAGILLISLVPLSGITKDEMSIFGWPVISLLTCIVIYGCLRAAPLVTSLLASRPMIAIGKRSYGLYLWHFPIFFVINMDWGLHRWEPRLAGLAATAVIVPASYRFIEQPFLARKDGRVLQPSKPLEFEGHGARVPGRTLAADTDAA
jgi:peptidoglycan/LPS O-acetylase OafA/YrhL